jgi:uncharacterized protein YqgQ
MSEAYDSYLLKKRAYDRAALVLGDALKRLRAYPQPLIDDTGCHIPLPGMSVHAYFPGSRRALEGSKAAKRHEIAELMKQALCAQQEALRAWDLLSELERAELKPPADTSTK